MSGKLDDIAFQMEHLKEDKKFDTEQGHQMADDLLMDALVLLSAGTENAAIVTRINTAFYDLPKWYA